jgi:IMP dehydrogenase
MMAAMAEAGGCGVLHKNLTAVQQVEEIGKARRLRKCHAVKDSANLPTIAIAVGVKDWEQRISECEAFLNLVVVDSAHGHSINVLKAVSGVKLKFPKLKIMAGNVSTLAGVRALVESGADIIKVGQGPGSICTTRMVSGCGMPQFTAVCECAEEADKHRVPIVADGGIKCPGDIVKAIGAGADAVMIGSMLAGATESPGKLIDRRWKQYRGMGSVGAMERGSKDRYGQSNVTNDKLVPEGVEAMVPHIGPVVDILHQLIGGLKSGMGYTGSKTIKELQVKARFVRVTSAGIQENGVHGVIVK